MANQTPANVTPSSGGSAEDIILALITRTLLAPESVEMTGFTHPEVEQAVTNMKATADTAGVILTHRKQPRIPVVVCTPKRRQ